MGLNSLRFSTLSKNLEHFSIRQKEEAREAFSFKLKINAQSHDYFFKNFVGLG
jgi:hypothetical protein